MVFFKKNNLVFFVFLLPLILYFKTLAPSYLSNDSAEFSLCIYFVGICHPPGFFLYILFGKVFTTLFPFGTLIYKANLLSAFFAVLTILFVYLTSVKLEADKKIAAIISLLLAISNSFWQYSVTADVFTFATFLLSLSLYFVISKKIYWSFFVLGLASSHLYMTFLLFPVFVWYFWGFKPLLGWVTKSGMFFIFGLFPLLLLYFRMTESPQINWGHVHTFGEYINSISRKEFGSFFLVQNPLLTFSILKFFKHLGLYFFTVVVEFAALPIICLIISRKIVSQRSFKMLLASFVTLFTIQLLTISTIDPFIDQQFQINKFYLLSYIPLSLLVGIITNYFFITFLKKKQHYLIIAILTLAFYLALNFPKNNQSNNFYLQLLVTDALSQLPQNSLVLTDNHQFYFGSLYEQKISSRFSGIRILYFPNENNLDAEKYHPELFLNPINNEFIKKVYKDWQLGKEENYILGFIARNLDKPIFVLQSRHNENMFKYLNRYLKPYGLWWRIALESDSQRSSEKEGLLLNLKDRQISTRSNYPEQQEDLITYSIAFHSLALFYAKEGEYDKAITYFKVSLGKNPEAQKIYQEINLVSEVKSLESSEDVLIMRKDYDQLTKLGGGYVIIGDYQKAIKVFETILEFDPKDGKVYTNIAVSYAQLGQNEEARKYYKKALELDPTLDLAKQGIDKLDKDD